MPKTIHIINHTHWDREWFLTSIYTSQWIPQLINKLEHLATENPDFRYFLDGQTLIIEDLLAVAPEYEEMVRRLIVDESLTIGPYYCQPDWQLTGGETLIRNLQYGVADLEKFGGNVPAGWLVDTFGHISQNPQIHSLFGIDAVYVWRGVPQLEPFFRWQGADGSELFAVNLFGGYRNLYGVTHAPQVAARRLATEIAKLSPYYPTGDIPLFDGYDLETDPEDPIQFFAGISHQLNPTVELTESTPSAYANGMQHIISNPPLIAGELNSGKYGATFPGVLSARTYLKILHNDCEQLLYRYVEPLAVLARLAKRLYPAEKYEKWSRQLLQNSVHDAICGVSIDQVHEKMEDIYRQIWSAGMKDINESLTYLLAKQNAGIYVYCPNPAPFAGWLMTENKLAYVQSSGIGIFPVEQWAEIESKAQEVTEFRWKNEHYQAILVESGQVKVGGGVVGTLQICGEVGDTYSTEPTGQTMTMPAISPITLIVHNKHHAQVVFRCGVSWYDQPVSAEVTIIFDQSPLIQWQIELDSASVNFRVEMLFETGMQGQLNAGMGFDIVPRPFMDEDLLPANIDNDLAKLLMGQREVRRVDTFPFHDFVAIQNEEKLAVVFAKGLRAYSANELGQVAITLRRSVEWLALSGLSHRAGDAGPLMYVPDARCERKVTHHLAFCAGNASFADVTAWNAHFQNPPLLLRKIEETTADSPRLPNIELPAQLQVSSLVVENEQIVARLFNPLNEEVAGMAAKKIEVRKLNIQLPATRSEPHTTIYEPLSAPTWRVGENQGSPNVNHIFDMELKIKELAELLVGLQAKMPATNDHEMHLLQHQIYVVEREMAELKLSVALNRLKFANAGKPNHDYLYTPDPEIARLAKRLNELRIKRRIYDYVVTAIE